MNCRICTGTGLCATCNGLGEVLSRRDQYERCDQCGGAGICPWCTGYGDAPDDAPDDLALLGDLRAERLADRIAGVSQIVWMPIASYRRIAQVAS